MFDVPNPTCNSKINWASENVLRYFGKLEFLELSRAN